jgi:TonB-linked SusC/RagA family outer membrane protein
MIRRSKLQLKLFVLGALISLASISEGFLASAEEVNTSSSSELMQQNSQKRINGTVRDNLFPLIGVAVMIEGTTTGTITDVNGAFELDVTPGAKLRISYIGYDGKLVEIGESDFYDIVLESSSEFLEEVVVVGYGTVLRKDVIGAIDQVQAKAIEGRPVANLTQALQGVSPGLVIQQRSMNPNDNSMNINIRGISSLNNNDPLLVIDGMVADNIESMNSINPNDIESVSVLKDAGSAAIYGSRSANGVILITTKKGKLNMKPEISFNASSGIQAPEILLKPVKGYQNALLRNDSYVNAGLNPVYSPQEIAQFATHDSEWGLNAIMKDAVQYSYDIGVRGGTENTSYNVSFGYYDQESNFKGQDFGLSRYNFRNNLVTEFGRFKLSSVLSYNRNESKSDRGGLWIADVMRVPTYNTYDIYPGEDGKYYNNEIVTGGNLLATLNRGGLTTTDNDHFQGIIIGELEIWNGLSAKGVLGYDLRSEHRLIKRRYYPVYDYINRGNIVNSGDSDEFHIEDYNGKITMLNTQLLLEYNRTFNDDHRVTGLLGQTSESFRRERNEIKRFYVDPDLYQDTDKTIYDPGGYNTPNGFAERALYSWLGRVGYTYKDKYFSEISGRYDGSSRFTEDQRWGFFPSVSLGWRISNEDFFSFWQERFGDLKLRGSYGILGSQSVDDYQFLTTYEIYTNQYGFNNSSVTGTGYTYGNDLLSWETSANLNVGFDATFFNNRLSVAYDYFNKYTKDILLEPQTPSTLGGAVSKANIGEMENVGWEVSVNYRLSHGYFTHFFGFNLGDSFNKVKKYGQQDIEKADEIERIIREDVPLYSYYGYKTDGLFQNADEIDNSALPLGASVQPGDVKYVDRNGDGVIDDNDRFILGNAFPRYTFGFNYSLDWKGLDMNMLWQGVGKRDMALRGEMIEPFHGSYYYVMFEHQLDYWSPGNTDAKYPRLVNSSSPSYSNNYSMGSDRNIYDAAYLRLKNIQVGYTLPERLTSKVGIGRLRIYASGQNLLTFTKNSFIDPESSEFGNSMNASGANSGRNYPTLKYYGGGVEVKF